MCIIVAKPEGVNLPKKDILQNCYYNNPDGCGYMFTKNNKVIIKKGFLDFNKFYKELKKDYYKNYLFNKNVVLHFRIATSGADVEGCCHPYPLTNKEADLLKVRTCANIGIAHNGILSQFEQKKSVLNDTQFFIKNFLYNLYNIKNDFINDPFCQKLIDVELKNSNKLAILTKDNKLKLYGDFVKDSGVYFSNTTYLYKYVYNTYTYNYNYDYFDPKYNW